MAVALIVDVMLSDLEIFLAAKLSSIPASTTCTRSSDFVAKANEVTDRDSYVTIECMRHSKEGKLKTL